MNFLVFFALGGDNGAKALLLWLMKALLVLLDNTVRAQFATGWNCGCGKKSLIIHPSLLTVRPRGEAGGRVCAGGASVVGSCAYCASSSYKGWVPLL